jgi:hypothetical protein
MTKTIKDAKKAILAALGAIEEKGSKCMIQVMKKDEEIFRKALQLFEVQVKIAEKKSSVELLISNSETLRLMIQFRTLCLSLLLATEQLAEATTTPQVIWLKTLNEMALSLIGAGDDQAAIACQALKEIGINEEEFVKALLGWKSKG